MKRNEGMIDDLGSSFRERGIATDSTPRCPEKLCKGGAVRIFSLKELPRPEACIFSFETKETTTDDQDGACVEKHHSLSRKSNYISHLDHDKDFYRGRLLSYTDVCPNPVRNAS